MIPHIKKRAKVRGSVVVPRQELADRIPIGVNDQGHSISLLSLLKTKGVPIKGYLCPCLDLENYSYEVTTDYDTGDSTFSWYGK